MALPGQDSRQRVRILIAEDSPAQAEQLRFLLEEQDFLVRVSANGRNALADALAEVPDLLISDVVMPEMDGYDLCRALKAATATRDVPFILVTTLTDPSDVMKGLDCGADNFITKPYDEGFLIARVRYLLTNAALRSQQVTRTGIEIDLEGHRHFITAERQQILDLLISTYAAATRFSAEVRERTTLLRESQGTTMALYGAAEQLNQAHTEEGVIRTALEQVRSLPFVEAAWLWLTDESGALCRTETSGLPAQTLAALAAALPCACRDGPHTVGIRPSLFYRCDRLAAAGLARAENSGHMVLPLRGRTRSLGQLNVIRNGGGAASEKEVLALSALCNLVAPALERTRLHDLLEQRVAERTARLRAEIAERETAQQIAARVAARLERAFSGANAGVWECDLATGETYYSPRFLELLGYDQSENATTLDFLIERMDDADREQAPLVRERMAREKQIQCECRLRTKEGSIRWFEIRGMATHDDSIGTEIMAGSIMDVSERHKVEDQLRQVQKMEAIGNLTGGIAHDFNNILMVVIGNLDLLQMKLGSDADSAQLLEEAVTASLRGAELTRGLLTFARRQPLRPSQCKTAELLQASMNLIRRAIPEDIEILLALGKACWDIFVDPAQLESALLNLVVNARDAIAHGGRILVGAENKSVDEDYVEQNIELAPGDYVVVSVSDTGHGMAPELIARIFEPFFTTKEVGKGTGLGLAMVFGFAKQSGGQIKVYSEVGVGTTMRLYLPRAGATATDPAEDSLDAGENPQARDESILVVEDNMAVRQAVVRQLIAAGYQVHHASDGATALAMLEAGLKVDLVFSDVVMPGSIGGADLARRVAERWPQIRVLLTSGFPQGLLSEGSLLPSDVALLDKPYRMRDLMRKLRALLAGRTEISGRTLILREGKAATVLSQNDQ